MNPSILHVPAGSIAARGAETLLAGAPASASSSPTTVEVVREVTEQAKTPFGLTWADLLGTPLRILLILIVAVILNFVARKLIHKFATDIARGTSSSMARLAAVEHGSAEAIIFERRKQRGNTVGSMLGSVASIVIFAIAILMILTELGFNLAPVLASAGIAGIAIGFGAQELVRDYLSGFFIVVEDQYGIGDVVDLGEAIGVVEEVGLRATKVRSVDGTLWHVRNGEILRVGNQSQGWGRAVLDVPVPYTADQSTIDDVIADTIAAMREDPKIDAAILEEPEIWGVEAISGESLTIRTVIKTQPGEQWTVARAFRARLKRQLDARGITIPLQQQTLVRTFPDPVSASRTSETDSPEDTAPSGEDDARTGTGVPASGATAADGTTDRRS